MAVIEGGASATVAGVGIEAGAPVHFVSRPITVSNGHYRTSHRCALVATQAANSRLFSLQNTSGTNLMILMRLRISWVQTAAHTAAIEDSLDVFRATTYTVVDTTNTVTPAISKLRTSFGTSTTAVRGVTVAGAAAGMTGGTMTLDTAPLSQMPLWLLAAVPTGGPTPSTSYDFVPNVENGESPLIFAQNEGLVVTNRVLLGAAAGSSVYIDAEWAETTAY